MYGQCVSKTGARIPCAHNKPAERVDDALAVKLASYCPYLWHGISSEQLACCDMETLESTFQAMQRAVLFISGCPACLSNFANLWCTINCSPDQATFTDVIKVDENPNDKKAAVSEVHYYMTDEFKQSLFDSCKEVKFSTANLPFLSFLGNPSTPDEFLGFLGASQEEGGQAPYSLRFLPETETPPEMKPHGRDLPGCGSPGFECSCADCSTADYCQTFLEGGEGGDGSHTAGGLRWYEYLIIAGGIILLMLITILLFFTSHERSMREIACNDHTSEGSYEPLSDGNEFSAVLLEGESVVYPAVEIWLRNRFRRLGVFIAQKPYLTILSAISVIALLSLGNINYSLVTDPQGLWTPKGSRTEQEQEKYETAFGKFYRVENLILRSTPATPSSRHSVTGLPSIATFDNIKLMFRLQDFVNQIEGHFSEGDTSYSVKLEDVCYKPLGVCVTQSVLQYWQMDEGKWDDLFKPVDDAVRDAYAVFMIDHCFQHWTTDCRTAFESPLDPNIVLGGFPTDASFQSYVNDTTAFATIYLLDSSEANKKAARAWEEAFLEVANTDLKEMAQEAKLEIAFMADRSTEDELDRETYMDAWTIVLSYAVMFLYIALSLTFLTKRHTGTSKSVLVQSHVILGLQGVSIVVLAVVGAFGMISVLGIEVSMIVLEVLPFLVLAVGVDNMFILANELRSFDPGLPLFLRVGSALAEVGPSITCAAMAEGLAFGLAAIAPIPAVRNFSLCACFAILLDFFLQCTLFTACLALDTVRRESNRVDCLPFLQLAASDSEEPEYVVWETGTPPQETQEPVPESILQQIITNYYIPFLLGADRKWVRWIVLCLTVAGFTASCVLTGRMELGMEQQVAFPRDSYLQEYFTDGLPLMRAGAPIMFVVEDLNVSTASEDVNKVCGIAGCNSDSLVSRIDLAASQNIAHLASPFSSWIDEFLMWLRTPSCCRTHAGTSELCPYDDTDSDCIPCSVHLAENKNSYQEYLPGFMGITPGQICPRGGKGAYEDYIQHAKGNSSHVFGLDRQIIQSSAFRSYYVPLITQNDYIEALKDTHSFVDDLKASLGIEVYAYSIFHVYFQQYLNLVPVATMMISVAIGAVFLVCWFLLSSFRTALIVMICVIMTVIDLIGASFLSDVKLNGVSVVNLTMSVGIAVEFCVHLAHGFLVVPGSRVGRMAASFQGVGVSVISGIALTKFLGVIVLAFAMTKLFQVYYFRMYMALVLLGAWHGLVVLPVLLALLGPPPPVSKTTQPVTGENSNCTPSNAEEAPSIPPTA